jgi:flagellar hook-length control protein FliK
LQEQIASLVSGDKTKTVAHATAGNSTQASTVFTEGQSGLQAQIPIASLTSRSKTDSQGSEPSSNSGLQVQTPSLFSVNKTEGQVSELSSKFAAALEAATDKTAGTTITSSPAGQISQPIGSPLASNQMSSVPTLPVDQHVGATGWGQEVGNRLVWMSNSTNSHAELVLTPPQMGRVEVSLSVTGDQATATFVSTNPLVREALEAAMPRLREILADAGIQLGQTQVGAGNAHQSAQQEKNGDNFTFGRNVPPDAGASQTIATAPHSASPGLKVGRGLVDVFA